MHLSTLHVFMLLVGLEIPMAKALPDCVRPPPLLVPSIQDCEATLSKIMAIARTQGNVPRIWSRHPRRHLTAQRLPALFDAGPENDCEILVDVDDPKDEDTFLTSKVAEVGHEIVNTCLLGSSTAEDTVGVESVGQKGVVDVWLRYKDFQMQRSENVTDPFVRSTGVARKVFE
ncbi:hypothetical protein N7G274_003376 [Stereocaulon virgatum]|uniref:Uncharacterized protein n=1 Tax=Stereocaulon virgatum TaxID=373712 RepID=A0ABR4AEF7_9LECA